MALTNIESYAVSHNNGEGGKGGTTIIQYGNNSSSYNSLNVNNINATKIVTDDIEAKTISAREGSILYLITKEGQISRLSGDSLEYNTGYIGTLAADEITSKKLSVDDLSAIKGWIEALNSKKITTEYLTVTKQAHFFELIIDKIRSVGGQLIITPASCVIDYVWGIGKNGKYLEANDPNLASYIDKFAIFWRAKDYNGHAISNDFIAGDQVICQSFNNVHEGVNYNASNKYYWRLVDSIEDKIWINLATGATTTDREAVTGNRYEVTMYDTQTTINNETTYNNIQWECVPQTIPGIYTDVEWIAGTTSEEHAQLTGTMISASKAYGIQITPLNGDNTITTSLKFSVKQVYEDINSDDPKHPNIIKKHTNNLIIGVYFKDGTFKLYDHPDRNAAGQIVLNWHMKGDEATPSNGEEVNAPIEAITIVSLDEVEWAWCNCMIVSNTDKDVMLQQYSSKPEIGDNLVQLGYRYNDNARRQNAIIISAYNSIDQGGTYDGKTWKPIISPSYAQYIGINDYNLFRHRQSYMDGSGAKFVGDITMCNINGENVGDKFDEQVELLNKMNTKIRLSTNLVELYEDKQGNIYANPATFDVDILRTDETGTSVLNAVPEGYKLMIIDRFDNMINSWTYNATSSTKGIETLRGSKILDIMTLDKHIMQCEVRLVMIQNGVADARLPVIASDLIAYRRGLVAVKDGGRYEFRYQNSHTAPAKPTTGSDGTIGGWTREVSSPDIANEIWTWMTYTYCTATEKYGTWSDPIRITGENGEDGADGASVEYIYSRNNGNNGQQVVPVAPPQTQTDDWYGVDPNTGTLWTDSPKGVSKELQYEYVSCRTKRAGGLWGTYSTPALWSKWGEKGMDGDGYEYIFKLTDSLTPPDNPTPNDWKTNPYYQSAEYHATELGWTDDPVSVTQNNKYLYVAVRTRKEGVWNPFSDPALWARYAEQGETGGHYEFRYKNSAAQPDAPTGQGTTDGWANTPTNPDVNNGIYTWMSQCYVTPGNPNDNYGTWSTPVRITGGNGEDGADGTDIEFVYTRTNTTAQVPTPATNQTPDWHGTSGGHTWTDNPQGVSSDLKYEWMSMRYYRNDVYSAYTTPVIWSAYGDKGMDGDGFEYAFKNTETAEAPTNPTPSNWETNALYQQNEWLPTSAGWTDDPNSVSESIPYEWVIIRKRVNGVWQPFSDPSLWARWAVQGSSGGHYEFRFNKSITKPNKPTGTGLTNGWSRNASNLTQQDLADGYVNWMSQCYVNGNDEYGIWGEVFRITGDKGKDGEDGQSIEFIYKGTKDNTAPSKPSNQQTPDWVPTSEGWTDNPSGITSSMPYEWVCSREINNGTWSDWNGPVLWSAWGQDGTDGDGVEYIFKKTSNSTAPSNPTPSNYASNADYQKDEYVPSGWSDDPPSLSSAEPFMWVSIRKGHAGSWGRFSNPAIWSHYAKADEAVPGENAQFSYLVPEKETLMALILSKITNGGNADLKCELQYKMCHVDGSSTSYIDWTTSSYRVRLTAYNAAGSSIWSTYITDNGKASGNNSVKDNTSTGKQQLVYTKTNLLAEINGASAAAKRDYMSCYKDYNSSCPVYLEITLLSGSTVIDNRVKYVDLENGAVWKLRDDAIVSAVAQSNTEMKTALNNYSTTEQTADLIKTTVDSQLLNYSTTADMNSAIEQSASKITHKVETNYYRKDEVDSMLNNENSFTTVLNLLDGGYSDNNYYPVSVNVDQSTVDNGLVLTLQVDRSLDEPGFQSGNHPEWGSIYPGRSDTRGVALICNWSLIPSRWGEFDAGDIYVNNYILRWTRKGSNTNDGNNSSGVKVIGNLEQHAPSSTMIFYLRGGSKYNFRSTWASIVDKVNVHKSTYTTSKENKSYPVIYGADSSSIKVPEKDKMSKSEIIQTAKNISLSVYSENPDGVNKDDLKRTGIDITAGKIELTADNTNISGNLNVFNANEGLQIYEGTTPKISILNRNLGADPTAMTDYKDVFFYKEITLKPGESTFDFGKLSGSKIDFGTFSNNTTVTLSDFSWNIRINLSENGVNGWYGGKNVLTSSNRKLTWSGPSNLSGSVTSYGNISSLNKSFTSNGAHEYMNITQLSGTVTGDGVSKYCKIAASVKGKVRFVNNSGLLLGHDAINICSPTENRYVLVNPDNFIIRNGKSIFRIKDGYIQRNDGYNYGSRYGEMGGELFGDISSVVPYKYVGVANYYATNNDAFIFVSSDTSSTRRIYLPQTDRTPKGKIIYIKNFSPNPCIVSITGNADRIIPANGGNRDTKSQINIETKSRMFLCSNGFWVEFYCG